MAAPGEKFQPAHTSGGFGCYSCMEGIMGDSGSLFFTGQSFIKFSFKHIHRNRDTSLNRPVFFERFGIISLRPS